MRPIKILLIVIAVFVVLEGTLLIAVFASPEIERDVRNAGSSVAGAWLGDDEDEGILASYRTAAGDFVTDWITPLWQAPQPEEPDFVFSGCLQCHEGYFEQQVFDDIFFDHRPHKEAAIDCSECHVDTTHPSPDRPTMRSCAGCHSETETPGECLLCHSPGALDHFQRMGVAADSPRDCTACHVSTPGARDDRESIISHPTFNGSDQQNCTACHAETFCSACHEAEHEPGWLTDHGASVVSDGMSNCFDCHSGQTCGPCHEGAPLLPLPVGGP